MWFYYHSKNGFAPRAVFAANRAAADAYILAKYSDGDWDFIKQNNAPEQGYQQESAVGTGQDASGTGQDNVTPVVPGPDAENQIEFQRAAYMQGIKNAGYSPTGALSGYLRDRFAPTATNFWANNALAEGRGDPIAQDFQGYSQANAGGGSNLYQTALENFRKIAGGASIGAPGVLDDPTNAAIRNVTGGPGGNYSNGEAAGLRGELGRLARYGARGQYSPWSTTILPSDQRLKDRFEEELYANTGGAGGGTQGLDWATFLKKAFGLK